MTQALTADQETHQVKAIQALKNKIHESGGAITFSEFMHFALYEQGLGYYVAGAEKIGKDGDFTTAPLISPLFSMCLAMHCSQYLEHNPQASILELGPGTGDMAVGILKQLAKQNQLPEHYYLLEVSPSLRAKQQTLVREKLEQSIAQRCIWIDTLPAENSFDGVILGNEVIDAMPIERIIKTSGGWLQQTVIEKDGQFEFGTQIIDNQHLKKAVAALPGNLPTGYLTEINTWLSPWMESLAQSLKRGAITLIDYGFPEHTFYLPERSQGTLMCHFQHTAHDNPLINLCLQDITAHVDFSALIEAADNANLHHSIYCNQTRFLIECGLTDLLSAVTNREEYQKLIPGVTQLTHPQEMGELFKVASFTKN